MGINLHSAVRGAITAINPDALATWRISSGYTTAADGAQTPTYTDVTGVRLQVQAMTGKDLQHRDMQNVQGVVRAVYMWGDGQGVVRGDAKGGDLLLFANSEWKVCAVLETWTPDATGFCKLGVLKQL